MENELNIRPYRQGDEKRILSLFQSIGNTDCRTLEWWKYRHQGTPGGDAIIWIAEDKEEIVAHLCAVPLIAKQYNKTVKIIRGGDAHVMPKYRRTGLFSKLILKVLNDCTQKGISVWLGLPNEKSNPAVLKLGFVAMEKIPKLYKIIKPKRISQKIGAEKGIGLGIAVRLLGTLLLFYSQRRKRSIYRNDLIVTKDTAFDDEYNVFWDQISKYIGIGVIRDKKYLNWRYNENPAYKYVIYSIRKKNKIFGFAVLGCLKEKLNVGRIMEFFVLPEELKSGEMLLEQISSFFTEEDVDMIQYFDQNPLPHKKIFKKSGYIKIPYTKTQPNTKNNFVIKPLAADINVKLLTNSKKWLISWGEIGTV